MQRPFLVRALVIFLAVAALAALALALAAGCGGGQDRTIGAGDVSLVFTNPGNVRVPVVVRWAEGDRVVTERFTVLVGGRVTLKTPRQLVYDIEMKPECVEAAQAAAAEGAPKQDEVIDATQG